jgi:hypothetical protein
MQDVQDTGHGTRGTYRMHSRCAFAAPTAPFKTLNQRQITLRVHLALPSNRAGGIKVADAEGGIEQLLAVC